MIRTAEAVLDGHADRFCDLLADAVLTEGYQVDPECYAQIEVGIWRREVWFSGFLVSKTPLRKSLSQIVEETGARIGLPSRDYSIASHIKFIEDDSANHPRIFDDQSIVIGWAGYDAKTEYLPPEQFLARRLRKGLIESMRSGILQGQGPDGKLLVVLREDSLGFTLESVIATIQHTSETQEVHLISSVSEVLSEVYGSLRRTDERWRASWRDVNVLVNPNGPLITAGSEGDNGQTGRKLVMNFYGPRIPIGGGAIHGKDLRHVDRLASYATRAAAVDVVKSGAKECKITAIYAPGSNDPLDVVIESGSHRSALSPQEFSFDRMKERHFAADDLDMKSELRALALERANSR
jgi:S-adenosylmethionine synthetase